MPNHFHGIIYLRRGTARDVDTVRKEGTARRAPTRSTEQFGKPTIGTIPTIVRAFKSAVSKRIHEIAPAFRWQRNYYEHCIRDDKSLYLIRNYIRENPLQWPDDSENHIDRESEKFKMVEGGEGK